MNKKSQLLYNSFEIILNNLPDLKSTVPDLHRYYGHTPAESSKAKKVEPLSDHIDLVNHIALKLIKINALEPIIERLIAKLCQQLNFKNKIEADFIKQLFFASIVFHDFGKLNENFQAERLGNKHFSKVNLLIGSQHSILSAYLFINHFLIKLTELESKVVDQFVGIICAFSNPILKHHSSVFDLGDIDSVKSEQLKRFVPLIGNGKLSKFLDMVLENKAIAEESIYSPSTKTESYPLFILLKLNFSLLTAADYLATLSYQYNTSLPEEKNKDWWGVFSFDKKIELVERFKKSESYNYWALTNPLELFSQTLSQVKDRSPKNLNFLRSRMLAEVILKLRQNNDANLFYLKAPTGAGKTNISLALAIELLQHDKGLNSIFYVFPFTTLITQAYTKIIETLGVSKNDIVQLHSKAEWNIKKNKADKEGTYGGNWENHIDNLFVHYPIVLLSHIRFFDILKGNHKESNYLLHRLANSVIIIDEIQSYTPKFWDHINYFITNYADALNIRFIVMSATLPEIGKLSSKGSQKWVELISNPKDYFQNNNFAKRVSFDFTLLEKKIDKENHLSILAEFIAEKSESYAKKNNSEVKVIVEFITKKSATNFARKTKEHSILSQYKLLMLTGTILEPRRTEVKNWLNSDDWLKSHPKIILISTQVVEAGVDIDMDIGFKDSSLIDSDEQLAGRVNRNASKNGNVVYLFNLDSEGIVYQKDERLKIQREHISLIEHKRILEKKDFNSLYDKIIDRHLANRNELIRYFDTYLEHLRSLRFTAAHKEFQLIENSTISLLIPIDISISSFSISEQEFLEKENIQPNSENNVSGVDIFNLYKRAILNQSDNYIEKRDGLRKIQSLISKFTISVYPKTAEHIEMIERLDYMQEEPYQYGYLYCSGHKSYYDYEFGISFSEEKRMLDFF